MKKLIEKIQWLIKFLNKDIWKIDHTGLPPRKKYFLRTLKIILFSVKGYEKDQCAIRASALTFFSVLSVVPVLAMAFGIAQGFGLANLLESQIKTTFEGQEQVLNYALTFSRSMLSTTKGGFIAGIGLLFLLWAVLRLLNNVEDAFNLMWEVKKPRTIMRKFTDYLTIMIVSPIFVILAGSLTIFIKTALTQIVNDNQVIRVFSPYLFSLLRLAPYILIWVVFIILYKIMPNTKVNYSSAIIAGIVAGSLYQVYQWAYITFQVGTAKYNAIYGSFAALPLFLIWMQGSWLIVLIGAEVSYSIQHIDKYGIQDRSAQISFAQRQKLALLIAHLCIKRFVNGEEPLTTDLISKELKIPTQFTSKILAELIETRVISAVRTNKENVFGYQPAQDVNRISIKHILDALSNKGHEINNVSENKNYIAIDQLITTYHDRFKSSESNKLLKDI